MGQSNEVVDLEEGARVLNACAGILGLDDTMAFLAVHLEKPGCKDISAEEIQAAAHQWKDHKNAHYRATV